jgi:ATP-dependent RNA helicase RhlE
MAGDRALVFTRTKHTANRVAGHLVKAGIAADAIHGNKSQSARERALASFKQGELRALVATDIAARGIDIDQLACVINYDLPNVPEAYVHRIGRTGRAGSSGRALSFCEAAERPQVRSIERLTRSQIFVVNEHPFAPTATALLQAAQAEAGPNRATAAGSAGAHRYNDTHSREARPNNVAPHASSRPGDSADANRRRSRRRRRGAGTAAGPSHPNQQAPNTAALALSSSRQR